MASILHIRNYSFWYFCLYLYIRGR